MARTATQYVCQACGGAHAKWSGRCDSCGAWNTLVEEATPDKVPRGLGAAKGKSVAIASLSGSSPPPPRLTTGIAELDRVFGGGLVAGSAVLVGGDPGIGKSTLLLQATAALARGGARVIYVSGEESDDQVRLRARRLGLEDAPVGLVSATNVRDIVATLDQADTAAVLVIDSIQTMYVDSLDSAPGTVAQVRTSAQELIRLAKRRGIVVLLVGHVTKDGQIAGPRVLEHMVDAVLYFEGERGHQFRILRAVKNHYGATDEIGVISMTDGGLEDVANPSGLFLTDRDAPVSGTAVFAGIEGTRPVLVELEALVAQSPLATPRRAVVGWDTGRLAMVLAVLDTRCGLALTGNDVYLNVAGGLKVSEPAADLAVAAALVSSLTDCPVPQRTVAFGEVGLSGEIRPVAQTDARLKEAAKLGFERVLMPPTRTTANTSLEIVELARLQDLIATFGEPAARSVLAR
ncbi:MAG: DNA repair protein RadA [Alphaproteobacteria bacterium]